MKRENQDRLNKIISLILLFLWCLLIFSFSNQNGEVSQSTSDSILILLNNIFNFLGITIDLLNLSIMSFIIRKLAHMFLYFVLFIMSNYVCYSYNIKKRYLYSLLFCLIYATSDEIHQLFINERSFGIIDIIIDFIGSLIGLLLIKLRERKI